MVRARNMITGVEFEFDATAFSHGYYSHKLGLSRLDWPSGLSNDQRESWTFGWDGALPPSQHSAALEEDIATGSQSHRDWRPSHGGNPNSNPYEDQL